MRSLELIVASVLIDLIFLVTDLRVGVALTSAVVIFAFAQFTMRALRYLSTDARGNPRFVRSVRSEEDEYFTT